MSLPVAPLALSNEQWTELGRLVSGSPRLAERAWVVLACSDSDAGNSGVAAELGLSAETVRKWRSRFTAKGAARLADGARPGRPKAGLVLTGAEREQLTRWARREKTSQVLALRAKIVLACADGEDNRAVAAQFGWGNIWSPGGAAGSPASGWTGSRRVRTGRCGELAERHGKHAGSGAEDGTGGPAQAAAVDEQALVRRYQRDGWTVAQCARRFGISEQHVRDVLDRHDAPRRRHAAPVPAAGVVVAAYRRHRSVRSVAIMLDASDHAVRAVLDQAGKPHRRSVPLPPPICSPQARPPACSAWPRPSCGLRAGPGRSSRC